MPVTTTSSPRSGDAPTAGISPVSSLPVSTSADMSAFLDLTGRGVHADSLAALLVGRDRFRDRGGGGRTDPGHLRDLFYGRRAQLLEGPEVLDQRLAPDLAEAGDVVEHALHHRLRA